MWCGRFFATNSREGVSMYDTLKGYVYKFMENGGRNPKNCIKFVQYVHEEGKTFEELPDSVREFLDKQDYAKSTKRNLTTTLNNFVKLVYDGEGMVIPGTIVMRDGKAYNVELNPHKITDKLLEAGKRIREEELVNVEEIAVDKKVDEEYQAFLEKYDRICGGKNG